MARTVGIGVDDFETIVSKNLFYVDKTSFIKEWWENEDRVTLIARPRRFGKTLNMSMLERFFSNRYDDQEELFGRFHIWTDEKFRGLAGEFPVISLSFADIKDNHLSAAVDSMYEIIKELYRKHLYLMDSDRLSDSAKASFYTILDPVKMDSLEEMRDRKAVTQIKMQRVKSSLRSLSEFLSVHFEKKVLIFLDEYDTPMQEAYIGGYWNEFTPLIRSLFNSAFKTNPFFDRAVMTGITRVSKESIFSDLNNLEVVTTTSDKYADSFGLTEAEVFSALDEQGLTDKRGVKYWYDGFVFGNVTDIYNPWSISNYIDKKKFDSYWANTSSNTLVKTLIREGDSELKITFEKLLNGETIVASIDEQIVYQQLDENEEAIWSLLLATGYLKVIPFESDGQREEDGNLTYQLKITNEEVKLMFRRIVREWFKKVKGKYNYFIKALLSDDVEEMNEFINLISEEIFSSFDTGKKPGQSEPERFYHGFVLGMMVDLEKEYTIKSNRESGYGRYDVMLFRKDLTGNGIIIEFKVHKASEKGGLEAAVQAALDQIEQKDYAAELKSLGYSEETIRKYGFAFEGKKVLIGRGRSAL